VTRQNFTKIVTAARRSARRVEKFPRWISTARIARYTGRDREERFLSFPVSARPLVRDPLVGAREGRRGRRGAAWCNAGAVSSALSCAAVDPPRLMITPVAE